MAVRITAIHDFNGEEGVDARNVCGHDEESVIARARRTSRTIATGAW